MNDDLSNLSMFDLFRIEVENQAQVLTTGLLALEREPTNADQLESAMRAAHSLKGAARIVGADAGVSVNHARIDQLLAGVDLLSRIANTPEARLGDWESGAKSIEIESFLAKLASAPPEIRESRHEMVDRPAEAKAAAPIDQPAAGDRVL